MTSLVVIAQTPHETERAGQLADELGLALITTDDAGYPLRLCVGPEWLELRMVGSGKPVHVDFVTGPTGYRRRMGGIRNEPIARAVGLKSGIRPTVIDACAGLGRDGFMLANLGCRVTLLERSPVIAALLRDGLERAMRDPELGAWLLERLQLIQADACDYLARLSEEQRPDVVYLDPMYPSRDTSALVKKEMRMLRAVVGDDDDAALLLEAGLRAARRRVVVKRPRLAPAIEGPEPSLILSGRSSRFDVYPNNS